MTARRGWAWGTTTHGEWLTIAGSRWHRPHLAETATDATPYPSNIVGVTPMLALVEEHGDYYRIIETAEAAR